MRAGSVPDRTCPHRFGLHRFGDRPNMCLYRFGSNRTCADRTCLGDPGSVDRTCMRAGSVMPNLKPHTSSVQVPCTHVRLQPNLHRHRFGRSVKQVPLPGRKPVVNLKRNSSQHITHHQATSAMRIIIHITHPRSSLCGNGAFPHADGYPGSRAKHDPAAGPE